MTKKGIVSDLDTIKTAVIPADPVVSETETAHNETATNYVYIGPSLPGAVLMENTVLRGGRKEISEYFKDVVETYPDVEKLIVPVGKLSESRAKVRASGNVFNKYYNDLLSQAKKGAVE